MTSTQDMVRPGECVDLYYYDGETSKKQCFPTTVNTRYVQVFQANLNSGGSSVFTVPPQNGLQDIVLQFTLQTGSGGSAPTGNNSIAAGWGYGLISRVSFRYGGSSQYFMSGDQVLQEALRHQPNRTAVNDVLNFGGNSITSPSGSPLAGQTYYANCVLKLPHSMPSGVGKSHPLPTDCLTQQVQITVETIPFLNLLSSDTTQTTAQWNLSNAQFICQQVMFNNQGDALPRRVDLATNAYAFPAEFVQQKSQLLLGNSASPQDISLTGFRSGEVKSIQIWLTKGTDFVNSSTQNALKNPFAWYAPAQVQMTYAGEIFARYESGSSGLFYLINNNKAPQADLSWQPAAGGAPTTNPITGVALTNWVELPFAQTMLDEDSHYTLVHGKPITNGIVNLNLTTPTGDTDWYLNVSYIYNTTLMFSQGTCDYVF